MCSGFQQESNVCPLPFTTFSHLSSILCILLRREQVFPALTNEGGHTWREFVAVLPKEGKYAGQPCGVCRVAGCSMFGRVFHQKNLATHARPRPRAMPWP